MDDFEYRLVQQVINLVDMDTNAAYDEATGFRKALEIYSGVERAREILFAAGHEY
jgi:hypothetical protein